MSYDGYPTLFSQITLSKGNIALFGRTILAAEQMCQALGVRLDFATADEFLSVNDANRSSWLPLASFFHPAFSTLTPENSVFILGRNRGGEVVACQACRFYDWTGTNFKDECESLRFWYDDPASMRNPGERATVSALAARGTTGKVAYSGAAWYRRDYRGKGLVEYLPRLSRAYAAGVWGTETTITMMAENNVKKGVFPRNGYRNIEMDVDVVNSQGGTIRFAYIWTKEEEMEEDLEEFLFNLSEESRVARRSSVG